MFDSNRDRRRYRRYAITLDLQYKVIRRQKTALCGLGVTSDLSSGGVAFSTCEALPPDSPVELAIHWPVLLNERCALKLVVFGRVVRSSAAGAAVKLSRYEFRTYSGNSRPALGESGTAPDGAPGLLQ